MLCDPTVCVCQCHDLRHDQDGGTFLTPDVISARLEFVEMQMQALQLKQKELRRLWNDRLPIARLLPEILLRVFEHCTPGRDFAHCAGDALWISFSHVCQRWRTLALDYAPLWSTFSVSDCNIDSASELITRSRRAPLSVRVRLPNCALMPLAPASGACHDLLQPFRQPQTATRIRSLELRAGHKWAKAAFSTLVAFPMLETLALVGCEVNKYQVPRVQLPGVFSDSLKQLSTMFLVGVCIPLESPVCSNLRALRLDRTMHSLAAFLDALKDMPFIEDLHLNRSFDVGPRVTPPSDTRIPMPRLMHLELADYLDLVICIILRTFAMPSTAVQDIVRYGTARVHYNLESEVKELAAALPAFLSQMLPVTPPTVHRVALTILSDYHHHCQITLSIWTTDGGDLDTRPPPNIKLREFCVATNLSFLKEFRHAQWTQGVDILEIGGPGKLRAKDTLECVYGCFPAVRTLVLAYNSPTARTIAGGLEKNADAVCRGAIPVFPLLVTIIVHSRHVGLSVNEDSAGVKQSDDQGQSGTAENVDEWCDMLRAMLRARELADVPILSLRLVGCPQSLAQEYGNTTVTSVPGPMEETEGDAWQPACDNNCPTFPLEMHSCDAR